MKTAIIFGMAFWGLVCAVSGQAVATGGDTSKPVAQQPKVGVEIKPQPQQEQRASTNTPAVAPTINAAYTEEKSGGNGSGENPDTEWTVFGIRARATDILLTAFNCLLVAVGIIVGGLQIRWMKKTVKSMNDTIAVMDETAKRELRAYVSLLNTEILELFSGQRNYTFKALIKYKNYGKTPAYNVKICGALRLLDVSDEKIIDFTVPTIPSSTSEFTLGVSQEAVFDIIMDGFVLDSELAKVREMKPRNIFIVGQIEYTDAFNDTRHTYFREEGMCYWTNSATGANTLRWCTVRCRRGNRAN